MGNPQFGSWGNPDVWGDPPRRRRRQTEQVAAMPRGHSERHITQIVGPGAVCAYRQFRLPSGRRIDLLAVQEGDGDAPILTVVELKAVKAGLESLMQLLDYVEEVRAAADEHMVVRGVLAAPEFEPRIRRLGLYLPGIDTGLIEPVFTCDSGCDYAPSTYNRYLESELGSLPQDLELFAKLAREKRTEERLRITSAS